MKILQKVFASLFALSIMISVVFGQSGERTYTLNTDQCKITWRAIKGEDVYSGRLKVKEGYIKMKGEGLEQVVVFADMQSLDCRACGSRENADKMMNYAKSSSFLNSDVMDFATFKMYKVEKYKGQDDFDFNIEGQLTIIGYSQTVNLPVKIEEKKDHLYAEGSIDINRALWNLNNPTKEYPENYIEQTVKLQIWLEGEKK